MRVFTGTFTCMLVSATFGNALPVTLPLQSKHITPRGLVRALTDVADNSLNVITDNINSNSVANGAPGVYAVETGRLLDFNC